MVYRFKVSGNPRAILTVAVMVILISTAFTLLVALGGESGLLFGLLSLAGAFLLFRYFMQHKKSYVETTEDKIVCKTSSGSEIRMTKSDISHCGLAQGKQGKMLYIYCENDDQLLTIPNDFHNFEQLVQEIAPLPGFEKKTLEGRSAIISYLSSRLGEQEDVNSNRPAHDET